MRRLCSLIVMSCVSASFFLPFLGAQNNPARGNVMFPLFVKTSNTVGQVTDFFRSTFEVINPNDSEAEVRFGLTSTGVFTIRVPGKSVRRVSADDLSPQANVTGWVEVTSTLPVIVQERITHVSTCCIGLPVPLVETVRSQIEKSPATETSNGFIKVSFQRTEGFFSNTGIAIVRRSFAPAASRADVTMVLRNERGEKIGEKVVIVFVNAQQIGFFTDIFSDVSVPSGFSGTLELISNTGIFFTAVQVTIRPTEERMEEPTSGTR